MLSPGVIREWHRDDGWGVIESRDTPGGCWAHYSQAAVDGYRSFVAGQAVWLESEAPGQDGFDFRAVRFWPQDAEPQPTNVDEAPPSGAYRSELRFQIDE